MSQENVEVVRALFETAGAWLDAGLEFLAPEIELHLSGAFPDLDAVYRGHEGVERFTDLFNAPWEELSVDAERFIDLGDQAKRTGGPDGRLPGSPQSPRSRWPDALGVMHVVGVAGLHGLLAGGAPVGGLHGRAAGGVAGWVALVAVAGAPVGKEAQRAGEGAAGGGELVDEPARALRVRLRQHQPLGLEPTQACAQHVGRDSRQRVLEVAEAARAVEERLHHQQGPAVANAVERRAERVFRVPCQEEEDGTVLTCNLQVTDWSEI
jgi:hypothetical protein